MNYFKDEETGERFAYDDEQVESGVVREGLVAIDDSEVEEIISPKKSQSHINQEARSYLASTDWYVIRKQETGVEIPDYILERRAISRSNVVEIE